jgi:hypothetical protein
MSLIKTKYQYAERHLAQCHLSKWHYTKHHLAQCHLVKCLYAERHLAQRHLVKCHYAERHLAECHLSKCHYTECLLLCRTSFGRMSLCRQLRWRSIITQLINNPTKATKAVKTF